MQDMRHPEVKHSRTGHGPLWPVLMVVVMALSALAGCSDWDTDTLGQTFVPANSQVRNFTHPLYVEYDEADVTVWGRATDEVEYHTDGLHVSIRNASDSLAVFVYGFPAQHDTLAQSDASLSIHSDVPYALYLTGLSMRSQQQPVLSGQGRGDCHIVLPANSRNQLYGSVSFEGAVNITGRGALSIDSRLTAFAAQTLQCQYPVTVTISSDQGNGIDLRGAMRSTQGSWLINAALNAITTPDSIVLYAGSYQGTAAEGAFLDAECGVYARRPTLLAASSWRNNMLDSAQVAQLYDSVQSQWQAQLDTLTFMADSTYQIFRNSASSSATTFRPRRTVSQPWFLVSNGTIMSYDTLRFALKQATKGK